MKGVRAWTLRLTAMLSRKRRERELTDEIDSHLQLHIDDNLRLGMSSDEARRDALLKLGGIEPTKEAYRDRSTVPFIENLLQDIRFAMRQSRKNPGFTLVTVVVLALGMCASISIFAFVDAALIKPLPYRDPARLVAVTERTALFPRANLSYPDYRDWKRLNKVFTSLEVHTGTGFLLSTSAGSVPVSAAEVSGGFFRTLGVQPMLGHDFDRSEEMAGTPETVILSYAAWQKRFGGSKDAIGRKVLLSGIPRTVIGVLPRTFHFALEGNAEFWTTLDTRNSCAARRSCHSLDGIARLKNGVSVQAALSDMTSIATELEKQYPDSNRGQMASVVSLSEVITGNVRPILLILLGGAGLLMLIACVNVASLLLVRSESRRREMAVRRALGASRSRLTGQFVTEGLILATAGCALGLLSAHWTIQLLTKLVPEDMIAGLPFLLDLGLSARLIAFAVAISLLATVLFSLIPTAQVSFSKMREGLAEGSRGSSGSTWRRLGSRLVILELAIAVVLLVGAGLLGQSLYRLLRVELGFHPDHLATLDVALPQSTNDEQRIAVGRQIVNRIATLPGVKSAAITSQLPVTFNGNTDWIRFVGRPYNGEHNEVNERDVSSDYFKTIGAKLLRGRYFTDAEDASKPLVVVINQALARKYFPGEDPIGRRFGDTSLLPKSIKQIIGEVDDIRDGSLDSEVWPTVYYPFNQGPDPYFSLVVRTSQTPDSVLPALSAAIHRIRPDIGTLGEATMEQRINRSQTAYLHRSAAWLIGAFAGLALLLAVIGLYGVIAYSVSQRTREIGVRMALGAESRMIYRLILKEAGVLTAAGIVLGIACSAGAAMSIRKLLFGTPAWDLPTLVAVAAVLGMSAILASFVPAHRAASVDPAETLRSE